MSTRSRLVFALALIAAAGACGSDEAASSTLDGTITVDGDTSADLPDGATIQVQLADISLADAAAEVVTEQVIVDSDLPTDYSLSWDDDLDSSALYAVQVRVELEDELLYITDTAFIYEPGESSLDVFVIPVGT